MSFNGNEIIRAKTSWILADVKTGRPVKAIAHIPNINTGDCQPIEDDFREIPDTDGAEECAKIRVSYHDTDYNGHVNHAVYFRWVYDLSRLLSVPKRICASFRSGAKLGELITIQSRNGVYQITRDGQKQKRPCAKIMMTEE